MADDGKWAAIRQEYITTNTSYRALAAKHGVSFSTLKQRAKREQWTDKKDKFDLDIETDTMKSIKKAAVVSNAGNLVKLQKASDNMVDAVYLILRDTAKFKRAVVKKAKDGEEYVDGKTIRSLAGALRELTAVIRDVYELPGLAERKTMEMAAERLRLEAIKAQAGGDEGRETGVVMIPPVMEGDGRDGAEG